MSARRVLPSTRMTVSGRFGNATLPSAAHNNVGGGMNRRAMSLPGVRSESPISTAAPLPRPPAKKKSRRALSGDATRATPSPRPDMSRSSSSQLNTICACPGARCVTGKVEAGRISPTSGESRGRHAVVRNIATVEIETTSNFRITAHRIENGPSPEGRWVCQSDRSTRARSERSPVDGRRRIE